MTVWAVVFSNYEPVEIDSLWATRALAERRLEELEEMGSGAWWVQEMGVGTE